MKKKAIICGITGQDGPYLAKFLLGKGYEVLGTSRNQFGNIDYTNLTRLGIRDNVKVLSMMPDDFSSVMLTLKECRPDEIYFLAGQSSVGYSFCFPSETIQSNVLGTLNILEAIKSLNLGTRCYFAGSGECFGDTNGMPANEMMPFNPKSPYAVSKASAYWLVNNYRESYDLSVCTGILFNHESSLRSESFVTQKIVSAARRIASGSKDKLRLGRLDISRDWGWAADYVEAMWLMLQQDIPRDYVIATGETKTLEEFVRLAFSHYGLDWQEYVIQDAALFRPSDFIVSIGDPRKAMNDLGWSASYRMNDVVKMMIRNAL